ncbi:MAG: hypothetical protein RR639_07980 [Hydrogenoanaerobacterium sp.]
MDSKKYFAELTRRLGQDGIETGDIENGMLTIKLGEYPACGVNANGDVYRRMGDVVGPEADEFYQQTVKIAATIHEYMTEMEQSTLIIVGDDEYSKLSDCEAIKAPVELLRTPAVA